MLGPHPGDRHLAGGAPAVHQGLSEDPEAAAAHEPALAPWASGAFERIARDIARVCSPPRAFSTVSGGYGLLTQHRTHGDSNSAGVLIPGRTFHEALTPHAGGVEVKTVVRYPRSLTT